MDGWMDGSIAVVVAIEEAVVTNSFLNISSILIKQYLI
jgi:hypothetical protein